MKKILALAVGAALLAAPVPCRAGSAGADPFSFLFLDGNARAVGMGGAYTSLADDSSALLYNPAGLGRLDAYEASFMHNRYFQGISQEYAALAAPQGWGADLLWLDYGGVQRTTLSNPDGAGLGSATASDLAAAVGYGRPLTPAVSVGTGVKLVRETLDGVHAQGFGVDVGLLCDVPAVAGWTFGAALQNLGPSVRFQQAREQMPMAVRFGSAYAFDVRGQRATLAADVVQERRNKALVGLGGEVVVARVMPLRLGFNTRNGAGPGVTAGVGWSVAAFRIDYAFVPFGDLGDSHRVSLTYRWGGSAPAGGAGRSGGGPPSR